MDFATHTPESLLPRSDSKNPTTTCKGITSSGRPCRRSLASSAKSSPVPSSRNDRGVLAVLREDRDDGVAAAAFYCWQHKDQAPQVANAVKSHTEWLPLQERTSIDTLVDRIGVINLEDHSTSSGKKHQIRRKQRDKRATVETDLPADRERTGGPLMRTPNDLLSPAARRKTHQQPPRPPKSKIKASLFCCIRDANDDEHPPSRHSPLNPDNRVPKTARHVNQSNPRHPEQNWGHPASTPYSVSRKPVLLSPTQPSSSSPSRLVQANSARPSLSATPKSSTSQTQGLLSFIPSHLSPQTTSILLNELAKPISSSDAEGYIYMFWLTPESESSKPDDDAASSLLEIEQTRPGQGRRSSDVLQRYASQRRHPTETKTILLKIGRAENVHRRLSQWAQQCSHNITLIRYYPYHASTQRTSMPSNNRLHVSHNNNNSNDSKGQALPRKVPHVHRVERLIHVELTEKRARVQGPCETCGREHREWFEMEATRHGLRAVDEVIRRWVSWAEQQQQQ